MRRVSLLAIACLAVLAAGASARSIVRSHLYRHTYAFGDGGPVVPMQRHDEMPSGLGGTGFTARSWHLTARAHSAVTLELRLPTGNPVTVTDRLPAQSGFSYASAGDPGGVFGVGPDDSTAPPYFEVPVCAPRDGDTLRLVFVNNANSTQGAEVQLLAAGHGSSC